VLVLVKSPLRWFQDASIAVTDASVSDVRICILLPLGGALTNVSWSCNGDRCLGSACVAVQTVKLQAPVYKYRMLLLHCGSYPFYCGRFPQECL
jgi:hypothetical protein